MEEATMRRFGHLLALIAALAILIAACGGPATTAAPQEPAATEAPEEPAATEAPEEPEATEAAAATEAPEEPAGDSAITVIIGGDPTTLDPQVADDGNERAVNDNIYETLLTRDQDMQIVPLLATAYEQLDDTTWQFTLREGVTFHNGEPFNADAVVFSVNRIIDPDLNSEQLSFFETITGAEKVDDFTVSITTNGPDPILPARMYWMKMVPPEYTAADADAFANNPVGTGPYKFVSWERAVAVTLEANADYWGGAPSIQTVNIRPITEESTRLAALQAGEADLVPNLLPEQIDLAPVTVHTPGLEFPIVRLNNQDGPLTDARLRQAINYAVDKAAIAEALFGGYAVVAQGQILTPGHFGFNPGTQAYEYDPDMAAQLIAEAGAEGTEIELTGEAGRWLKDKELIEVIAGQLSEVGLVVTPAIHEWSAYLDFLFAQENQPAMIFVSHDNTLLDADRTLSALYLCGGRLSSYCNEEVSALVESGRTETDIAAREQMYNDAVQMARDDAAHLYLVNFENIYGLSERLNWTPRLDGKILFATMSLE
jgi:peptide/nickel transport system substrate-binding protein